ncbi:DMT family transporter [Desulfospira joergensenii]|uniref:DMT family transporter n=1 Tax=Desulfospira joergensenii TaxID=53329 RepID=UPI0003B4004A|nr:DMT family transporter [Desulfospira joergensenii]
MKKQWAGIRVTAGCGLALAVFFWGVNNVIARGITLEVRPMAVSFFRWVSALVFLTPFALKNLKKDMPVILENKGFLFLLSIPSVAVYNSLVYVGANFTTATNISLMVAAMPALTLGFAWAINREAPGLFNALGILVSMAGVVIIISQGSWQVLSRLELNPGDLMILVAISSWALYSVMLKKRPIPISPVSFLLVIILLGTPFILPFYLWEYAVYGGFSADGKVFWIFVFLGICPSILSYLLWNSGVRALGASLASVFIYLVPLSTSIIAYFVLGERISLFHAVGGVLILAGLILSASS